jgi:hypothetical protein
MNQNSGSGKRESKSQQQRSPPGGNSPSGDSPAASAAQQGDNAKSGNPREGGGGDSPPPPVSPAGAQLTALEFQALADDVTSRLLKALQEGAPIRGADGSNGLPSVNQPATTDPSLSTSSNPLRDEYKKNIEAHRNKRWYAFWGISSVSIVFFAILGIFICRMLSDNFLPAVIGAASSNWEWHILVFLGAVLALTAAIPLSLAMALVKMISDKEKDESDGGDMKAPGIELAKAIVELCKSVTSALTK